ICQSPNQATSQLLDRASYIVGIITILFAGDQYVQGVMDIVIPLRIVCSRLALRTPAKRACLVALIFYNEVNFPSGPYSAPNRGSQFREDVRRGVVNNGMNRVQSQSVKIIF